MRCIISKKIIRRAVLTAFVVGTILTLLNHGDLLISGKLHSSLYWKIPLTYVVPFLVTIWGALGRY